MSADDSNAFSRPRQCLPSNSQAVRSGTQCGRKAPPFRQLRESQECLMHSHSALGENRGQGYRALPGLRGGKIPDSNAFSPFSLSS